MERRLLVSRAAAAGLGFAELPVFWMDGQLKQPLALSRSNLISREGWNPEARCQAGVLPHPG
jgi:hypothetical protein